MDNSPLVLVGFLVGAEVDRMAHILRLGENLPHREAVPAIRPGDVLSAFPDTPPLPCKVCGRRLDLRLAEHRGDLIGAAALNGKLEDTPHDRRRFLVNQPVVFVVGVFPIAVDSTVGGGFAGLALDPNGSALLAAQVPQIPFRHDVDKRSELTGIGVGTVNAVADGDEAHPKFSEKDFRIESGLQIISPDSAHVLCEYQSNFPCLNVGHQPLPCRPVEVAARPSVIGVVDDIGKAVLGGVALQVFFLIHDRITVPSGFIVTREPLV